MGPPSGAALQVNLVELRRDLPLVAVSYGGPFCFAVVFFHRWLFRDYEVKSLLVQVMFAVTFMMSVNLQELVLFEIMGVLDPSTRWLLWKVDLYVLIFLLTVMTPICFFFNFVRHRHMIPLRGRVFIVVAMYSCFLYMFSKLGAPRQPGHEEDAQVASLLPSNSSWFSLEIVRSIFAHLLSIEYSIGRIGILGVAAMATLSGFGAVHNPYKQMSIFLRPVNNKEIESLEQRALQTLSMIAAKKKRLVLLERDRDVMGGVQSSSSAGALGKAGSGSSKAGNGLLLAVESALWLVRSVAQVLLGFGGASGGDVRAQVAALNVEIRSLEDFHKEIFLDIAEMHYNRDRFLFSKTIKGWFWYFGGYFLSMYCIYKCLITSFNILTSRDPKNDPVTIGFAWFFFFFKANVDVHFWSQLISLVLVGILVFTSVRGFLITIAKIFHHISTSISSNMVVLLLLQIMGMYFISFTLLMRMNLPQEYRQVVTEVLGGDIEFRFYHRFFDRIFLISALSTMLVIYVFHQQKQARTKMHMIDDKIA